MIVAFSEIDQASLVEGETGKIWALSLHKGEINYVIYII
jgi:hypothetical protein